MPCRSLPRVPCNPPALASVVMRRYKQRIDRAARQIRGGGNVRTASSASGSEMSVLGTQDNSELRDPKHFPPFASRARNGRDEPLPSERVMLRILEPRFTFERS